MIWTRSSANQTVRQGVPWMFMDLLWRVLGKIGELKPF